MSAATTSITTSTSTSTTTTTTTPVKVVDKSKKVEEILETTTTTSKTTVVTPIKEEGKKKKIVNKVWNDSDPIRGQLFRDLYFGRYGSETAATEIHRDPERDYSQYNLQTIQRKVRETRFLVEGYRGAQWLDNTRGFKENCRLDTLPTKEEKKGRVEEYKRWEKLQPTRKDLEALLADFVALSVKSRAKKP
mmetsp:Transcript_19313/g.47748  ORF Transcript_19313/g.47748 Transcript_19313/m.47748 type:complete len:191 (-) Transcript_19313:1399-1971(-)